MVSINVTALSGALAFAILLDKLGFSDTEGLWFVGRYIAGSTRSFTLYHVVYCSTLAGSTGSDGGWFNTVALHFQSFVSSLPTMAFGGWREFSMIRI